MRHLGRPHQILRLAVHEQLFFVLRRVPVQLHRLLHQRPAARLFVDARADAFVVPERQFYEEVVGAHHRTARQLLHTVDVDLNRAIVATKPAAGVNVLHAKPEKRLVFNAEKDLYPVAQNEEQEKAKQDESAGGQRVQVPPGLGHPYPEPLDVLRQAPIRQNPQHQDQQHEVRDRGSRVEEEEFLLQPLSQLPHGRRREARQVEWKQERKEEGKGDQKQDPVLILDREKLGSCRGHPML
mmetsp:Transcript_10567/g.25768  ORF Transcript_10567/g.25768 Transcript_10567/m.25768 type:complete len:239 (+) Transcript_10567:409-1125(+)